MKVKVTCVGRADFEEKEIEAPEGTIAKEAIAIAGFLLEDQWLFVNGEAALPDKVLAPNVELAITQALMGG